jgi:c-di-GMP-binding flagellar brake protein YcgR
MQGGEDKLLRDAIARNCGAVLSLPSAGMLRHCKSRFIGDHPEGLLMQGVSEHGALVRELIQNKQDCVVAFKSNIYKVAFATQILHVIPHYPVSADTLVEAVLLAQPQQIKTLQRRAYYRARVSPDCGIRARIWRIAEKAYLKAVPMHAQEVACELRDLSVGGLGARFVGKDGVPPKITTDDRLRIQITAGDNTLLLEGRMCDPRGKPGADTFSAGVCFKKLEENLEGRQILAQLTRMVGDLQREELRQHRLGISPIEAA